MMPLFEMTMKCKRSGAKNPRIKKWDIEEGEKILRDFLLKKE